MDRLIMPDYAIGRGKTSAVISSTGGTTKSFNVNGKEIFFPWRQVNEDKERGGCPICSPWFGSSPLGIKKHGFLRNTKASEVTVGRDWVMMTFPESPTEKYPWLVKHFVEVIIPGEGILRIRLRINRLRGSIKGEAPILPGLHPYFSLHRGVIPTVTADNIVFSSFPEESRMISLNNSTRVITVHSFTGGDVAMELKGGDWNFVTPHAVLWSDSPEEYFCAEPIFGDRRLFNDPNGFYLKQGGWLILELIIKVL